MPAEAQAGRTASRRRQEGKVMDDDSGSLSGLDDFEVIAERARLAGLIAALTDQYRALNREMGRRRTMRWMLV
jgi:hypothetical protein